MKKITVTICIPAFNEQCNIAELLSDIVSQKSNNFVLDKIIVASDGSTDNTNKLVRNFNNKKIMLIESKTRKGMAYRENQLCELSKSDILVLLNADIRITDKDFLYKLTLPITKGNVDLTSCKTIENTPKTLFEKILFTSTKLKTKIFESYNKGENVYTCHGQARAFSKSLYKKINFEFSVGEDAFSYFFCISEGFRYAYVKNTRIIYQLPSNYYDHRKQSLRFLDSKKLMRKRFGTEFVDREYAIPNPIYVKRILETLIINPFDILSYAFLYGYMTILSLFITKTEDTWSIARSSKKISI